MATRIRDIVTPPMRRRTPCVEGRPGEADALKCGGPYGPSEGIWCAECTAKGNDRSRRNGRRAWRHLVVKCSRRCHDGERYAPCQESNRVMTGPTAPARRRGGARSRRLWAHRVTPLLPHSRESPDDNGRPREFSP